MVDKKRQRKVNVRLDDVEMGVLKKIKQYSGFTNNADSIRQCIRFTNIMFDNNLTIEKAVIPAMMDVILRDENFRQETPLIHILKKVHQLEDELYPANNKLTLEDSKERN